MTSWISCVKVLVWFERNDKLQGSEDLLRQEYDLIVLLVSSWEFSPPTEIRIVSSMVKKAAAEWDAAHV